MCTNHFVVGVRNEGGDFVIKANGDGSVGQLDGRRTAISVLRHAAKEYGVTKLIFFR